MAISTGSVEPLLKGRRKMPKKGKKEAPKHEAKETKKAEKKEASSTKGRFGREI